MADTLYKIYVAIEGFSPQAIAMEEHLNESDIQKFMNKMASNVIRWISLEDGAVRSFSPKQQENLYWVARPIQDIDESLLDTTF